MVLDSVLIRNMRKNNKTYAVREHRPPPRHVIISKWENTDVSSCIHYPDGDPDHSQNIIEYKMDQDPSSDCVHDGPFSSIYISRKSHFSWKGARKVDILKYQPSWPGFVLQQLLSQL